MKGKNLHEHQAKLKNSALDAVCIHNNLHNFFENKFIHIYCFILIFEL